MEVCISIAMISLCLGIQTAILQRFYDRYHHTDTFITAIDEANSHLETEFSTHQFTQTTAFGAGFLKKTVAIDSQHLFHFITTP